MVRRDIRYNKPVIILEEDERGFMWIYEEDFHKLCEDIFPEVKADPRHKLRGKTLKQAILEDTADEMGWGKYKKPLQDLGIL